MLWTNKIPNYKFKAPSSSLGLSSNFQLYTFIKDCKINTENAKIKICFDFCHNWNFSLQESSDSKTWYTVEDMYSEPERAYLTL